MIVRRLDDEGSGVKVIDAENWTSRRLLLRDDGMGFSLHDTVLRAGTSTPMCYENHLEAVYCVKGEGSVKLVDTGEVYEIRPGTLYALNLNDKHVLTADTDLRMICVFNPALVGSEMHDENGAYPAVIDRSPFDMRDGKA